MAHRVVILLGRIGVEKEFAVTGGIAKNVGVVQRVEKALGLKAVEIKPDPQIAEAVGAADRWNKGRSEGRSLLT